MSTQKLPKSLARLVSLLATSIENEGALSPLRTKEIVQEADVQIEDMMEYAAFDHPVEDCYGRNLIHDAGNFEIMAMSWKPGDYSSIHNHGYTEWGVVQTFGHCHHMLFHIRDNELRFSRKEILTAGSVVKVNNALIHQMGNGTSDPYMTLHVYGCNERDHHVTADAKNYALELDQVILTCGGAFFNLPEDPIHDIEPGPVPTNEVFIHNAGLVMDYYNRQEPSPEISERKAQLLQKLENVIMAEEMMLV
ncbi:MAG: cysteine dioxygenase family protein [Bacteroidia bacterium]